MDEGGSREARPPFDSSQPGAALSRHEVSKVVEPTMEASPLAKVGVGGKAARLVAMPGQGLHRRRAFWGKTPQTSPVHGRIAGGTHYGQGRLSPRSAGDR